MGKLSAFNFITLNGYYKGINEDISWHQHGGEEEQFSIESLQSDNILLFGRITYEMMANWWPTPMAIDTMPDVAEAMNKSEKIVFSRTLKKADWTNTRIIKTKMLDAVKKLKETSQKNLTILGSGSLVTQLAEKGLIDTFQFMIDPIAIGEGTPLFHNINKTLNLKLTNSRVFKSGTILLSYESK